MSFFQGVKNFFSSKPKPQTGSAYSNNEPMSSKVISFNNGANMQEEDLTYEDGTDERYDKIQQYPSLKDLGLKKDEIEEGEIAILHETKFIFSKGPDKDKYEETQMIVTNYKIWMKTPSSFCTTFPLAKIDKLQKYIANESIFKLLIRLKDGRKFKFRVNSENMWKKFYERIQKFSFFTSKIKCFAFRHFESNKEFQQKFRGWKLFDFLQEFKRMGITLMPHTEDSVTQFTSDFKILDNKDGKVCTTYPQYLIVPSRMSYDSLLRCSKFRSRQRMPVLTYAYEYEKGKFSCVFRSSQCKSGVQNNRSIDDELMLRVIGDLKYDPKTHKSENEKSKKCRIYDARNYYAAFGNKFQGKGYESLENYQNCELQFLNIPNIHSVRDSYNKILDATEAEDPKFFNILSDSKWYQVVFLILSGAMDLAFNLKKGANCLVHCSDGWDRTSQLCALSSIILDPFYRTIKGFQILIEKDWLYFGHQFSKRIGQGMNNPGGEEKSPIFLQYLDCVTQLMYQFPSEFQFNYNYISELADQAYNHLYGNFLCNCYKQMERFSIFTKTVSLWSKIKKYEQLYLNPFYLPKEENLLNFDSSMKNMRIWKEYFFQYSPVFKDVYDIYSCKFTDNNLEIMHKHTNKEKQLLQEKYQQNEQLIKKLRQQLETVKGKSIFYSDIIHQQEEKNEEYKEKGEKQEQKVEKVEKQEQKIEKIQSSVENIEKEEIKIEKQAVEVEKQENKVSQEVKSNEELDVEEILKQQIIDKKSEKGEQDVIENKETEIKSEEKIEDL